MESHTSTEPESPGEYEQSAHISSESSIRKTPLGNAYKLIIDQADTHVHCRLFVNHALSGKLCFRVEEFEDIKNMIAALNGVITDESRFKREDYAYRKLHKSRGPFGRRYHGESDPAERERSEGET